MKPQTFKAKVNKWTCPNMYKNRLCKKKKMYETSSCKYIALACHSNSYNKNGEQNHRTFLLSLSLNLYKNDDSQLFITDQVSLVSVRIHAHWCDWSWTVAMIIRQTRLVGESCHCQHDLITTDELANQSVKSSLFIELYITSMDKNCDMLYCFKVLIRNG